MQTRIVQNKKIASNCFLLRLFAPEIACRTKAGQFVMIKVNGESDPFLRRPMSICGKDERHLEILYQVTGQGTRIMANKNKGEELDIIGPLGNGFTLPDNLSTAFLIAGGIGIAPLMLLVQEMNKKGIKIFLSLGAKTKKDLPGIEIFKTWGIKTSIFTEDGSLGEKGLAPEGLNGFIKKIPFKGEQTMIYSCGPQAMLKRVSYLSQKYSLACQVSLEQRMACGFGVCLGCVIKTPQNSSQKLSYKCVCTQGPVFESREIIW